jgi:hypothetical protein
VSNMTNTNTNLLKQLIKMYPEKQWDWDNLLSNPNFTVFQIINTYFKDNLILEQITISAALQNPNTTYSDILKLLKMNNLGPSAPYANWLAACSNVNLNCETLELLITDYPNVFKPTTDYDYSYYYYLNPNFTIQDLEKRLGKSQKVNWTYIMSHPNLSIKQVTEVYHKYNIQEQHILGLLKNPNFKITDLGSFYDQYKDRYRMDKNPMILFEIWSNPSWNFDQLLDIVKMYPIMAKYGLKWVYSHPSVKTLNHLRYLHELIPLQQLNLLSPLFRVIPISKEYYRSQDFECSFILSRNLNEQDLIILIDTLIEVKLDRYINWSKICLNYNITLEFINNYSDHLDFKSLSVNTFGNNVKDSSIKLLQNSVESWIDKPITSDGHYGLSLLKGLILTK